VDAVGVPGVKVPEVELEPAAGAVGDVQAEELCPPVARSRERLLSRYAVVEGEGTVELGEYEEGEDQERPEIGTRSATNAVATARSSPLNTQRCSQTKWRQHSRSTKERGQRKSFRAGPKAYVRGVDFKVKRGIHDPMADSTNCRWFTGI